MRHAVRFGFAVALSWSFAAAGAFAQPFSGTAYISPNIITSLDPSSFIGASYTGQANRVMFDRRQNAFVTYNAFLFQATYNDGLSAEIQVNPEFGSAAAASSVALQYGVEIGRLPTGLRSGVETVWIHQGVNDFGGGNRNILIHTGQAAVYQQGGYLEEILFHEATHTSVEPNTANTPGWLAAQIADGQFISTYARDNPTREDVAESLLPYWATRYRSDRISPSLADTITTTIPNRIDYFDSLNLNLTPVPEPATLLVAALGACAALARRRVTTHTAIQS